MKKPKAVTLRSRPQGATASLKTASSLRCVQEELSASRCVQKDLSASFARFYGKRLRWTANDAATLERCWAARPRAMVFDILVAADRLFASGVTGAPASWLPRVFASIPSVADEPEWEEVTDALDPAIAATLDRSLGCGRWAVHQLQGA